VRTRWNSTYAMIKRACEFRGPLSSLAKSDSAFSALSDEEWDLLDVVAQVLGVFERVSQPLCAANHPTLNKVVPTYECLFNKLEGFLGMHNKDANGRASAAVIDRCSPANRDVLRTAIKAALAKLRSYYEKPLPRSYVIATLLDPKLKMVYFEERGWKPSEIRDAKAALQHAVEEYETAPPRPDQDGGEARLAPFEKWTLQGPKRRRIQQASDVERYLAAPTVDGGEDVLEWWSRHASIYPALARVAQAYLAIPATSVPVERVFSSGADMATHKRGSLGPHALEALVCEAAGGNFHFAALGFSQRVQVMDGRFVVDDRSILTMQSTTDCSRKLRCGWTASEHLGHAAQRPLTTDFERRLSRCGYSSDLLIREAACFGSFELTWDGSQCRP